VKWHKSVNLIEFFAQVIYDFQIQNFCQQPDGFLDFWNRFGDVVSKLYAEDGNNIVTGFENNKAIKPVLLLLKKLAPRNMGGRNLIALINKLIRAVKVFI
jgi:hypothetical protein